MVSFAIPRYGHEFWKQINFVFSSDMIWRGRRRLYKPEENRMIWFSVIIMFPSIPFPLKKMTFIEREKEDDTHLWARSLKWAFQKLAIQIVNYSIHTVFRNDYIRVFVQKQNRNFGRILFKWRFMHYERQNVA